MGWRNPPIPWSDLEKHLSGRSADIAHQKDAAQQAKQKTSQTEQRPIQEQDPARIGGDGGDSPAWSRKRPPYEPVPLVRTRTGQQPYAELHCHSNFSFLDGASHPEELIEEATRLELSALALTDHNGFYGVVRFAAAARSYDLPTIFGAELSLGMTTPQMGEPDPEGEHLVVLARNPDGYARLARAISGAQMAGEKGAPRISIPQLADLAGDDWVVLTGCRKGPVPRALEREGPAAAQRRLAEMVDAFGADNVRVELWDHGQPIDSARNDGLIHVAARVGVDVIATNNVHYATPARRPLATALAAVRSRRSLDEVDGWLPASGGAHLRSGAEQTRRFARYPGVVEQAAELGLACAFDLSLVAPQLPDFGVPDGHTEMSWLTALTEQGALHRYGTPEANPEAWGQIRHELDVIDQLGFPGYFLIVWEIIEFCRRADIYCQGRGSAANSAVCYALGITKVDAVDLGLLFERFLSPERDGPPDIDLDIESDRREEVIQHVYESYGREHTAQVANVITYRAKSSVRDMAKALGYAPGQQDAWSKQIDRWGSMPASVATGEPDSKAQTDHDGRADHDIPQPVLDLAGQVEHFPRHLGIHSGGMVICDRPVIEVCPVEWARMEDRSVLQWDKDDCAAVGLVKFDLLGLGMLSVLHYAIDLIGLHHDLEVDLATIPQDEAVYDMLCEADSIGVFQVESRAQMATLPRLRPRHFYDLVVEVALIRPGPIQGGSVHPYIRRRNGQEEVTYLHPLLEPSLAKTLGIPLFQEQLMQMAIDVAGFSPGEADELRQAMGSKRSQERMARLADRLYEGMAERGVTGAVADEIYEKLAAFANFGFPESHSVSFAYLVYASAWIKRYYPAAFCAALLNAQPMGFYSPHSLVQDARRHGVKVRTPHINESDAAATLEPCADSEGGVAVRLGLSSVRSIGDDLALRIAEHQPYTDMEDLVRRVGVPQTGLEALATAGAFDGFGDRREVLWAAGAVSQSRPDRLDGIVTGVMAPQLPGLDDRDKARSDLWATGISYDGHPTRFLRDELDQMGVLSAEGLWKASDGTRVWVGGVVSHRQRPVTAGGTTFINLEDETGLINVIVSRGCWARHRRVARSASALLIRGRLEVGDGGVRNVLAERIELLSLETPLRSRDFR